MTEQVVTPAEVPPAPVPCAKCGLTTHTTGNHNGSTPDGNHNGSSTEGSD